MVNSNLVQCFAVAGALLLLGVHVHCYRLLSGAQEEERNLMSPILSTTNNSSNSNPLILQHQPLKSRRRLTPLQPIDREQYTIRINTWQRLDQLLVSIDHHASCPGVAQIQVVWCEPIDPPEELLSLRPDKVLIEKHAVNSLNERFHILPTTQMKTVGILSIDDDVLRPCDAIDSGFFQWTQSPSRLVGFDYRIHVTQDDGSWKYGYLSTTQKKNRYSMSLPRYAFLHRDYLDWYMTDLPKPIFEHVAEHFNCEDIAMSFFISSLTDGKPPLLAHFWAIDSMVKLYSPKRISGSKHHKELRDGCVESFAQQMDLKGRLRVASVLHRNDTMFYCGDQHYEEDLDTNNNDDNNNVQKNTNMLLRGGRSVANADTAAATPDRIIEHDDLINQWRILSRKEMLLKVVEMKDETSVKAKFAGLIEHTNEWEKKYPTSKWK